MESSIVSHWDVGSEDDVTFYLNEVSTGGNSLQTGKFYVLRLR